MFADGGEALAGSGVASAADDAADVLEEGEVGGFGGAGDGEVEGDLFEDVQGGLGELMGAVGGELKDLGSCRGRRGRIIEVFFQMFPEWGGAVVEAEEG